MNKEEAMRLAINISSKPMPWNGEYTFRTKKELLAFANACERAGMEKADERITEFWNRRNLMVAESIRNEIK